MGAAIYSDRQLGAMGQGLEMLWVDVVVLGCGALAPGGEGQSNGVTNVYMFI